MDTGAGPSPTADTQKDEQSVLSKDAFDPSAQADDSVEGVAAADNDPSQDMREDSRRVVSPKYTLLSSHNTNPAQ
jgi:hypothetical protein